MKWLKFGLVAFALLCVGGVGIALLGDAAISPEVFADIDLKSYDYGLRTSNKGDLIEGKGTNAKNVSVLEITAFQRQEDGLYKEEAVQLYGEYPVRDYAICVESGKSNCLENAREEKINRLAYDYERKIRSVEEEQRAVKAMQEYADDLLKMQPITAEEVENAAIARSAILAN